MEYFMYWCEKHSNYHETEIPKTEATLHAVKRLENACN